MSEDAILAGDGIEITKTLARIQGVSYPINGIGSVLVKSPSKGPALFLAVCAIILGLLLLASDAGTGTAVLIIGAIIGVVAYRRPYVLVLRTASGDQRALSNRNGAALGQIKAAIEEAVRLRG